MPIYDDAYHRRQIDRVGALIGVLADRANATRQGRTMPDHGDLPIGSGRRFDATVIFLDICGSSSRGSDNQADQQVMLLSMTIFFSEVIRIVEDHGGRVEKNTGDGLMAYFSAGEAGAQPQQTALSACLTIFATYDRLLRPLLSRLGFPFDFRICLDHGPITVAEVGASRGFRGIVAIGTTANVAAKMLQLADANSIFLGQAVVTGLPLEWRTMATDARLTGWQYPSGLPYYCYRYTGRWPQ